VILVPTVSSAIYALGYDEERRTLDVIFFRSGVYRYFDVPKEVYDQWLSAESKGRYLRQNIVGNYRFERLGPRRRHARIHRRRARRATRS
jgi:hypothetical protein